MEAAEEVSGMQNLFKYSLESYAYVVELVQSVTMLFVLQSVDASGVEIVGQRLTHTVLDDTSVQDEVYVITGQ